jgi:type II secretory pathway pseudopilin PulG
MLPATLTRMSKASRSQEGFSLLETMLVVLLLMIVLGVATTGLIQIQKRSNADEGKVDMTQMSRQFLDQIINDLHQSGYPSPKLFDPATASASNYALGLLTVDANTIEFEGDVDVWMAAAT